MALVRPAWYADLALVACRIAAAGTRDGGLFSPPAIIGTFLFRLRLM
jgi:hypothetical protein